MPYVADYVTRYAKKGDAMPKHSMGDDSGSDDGSDGDEKGFLSSRWALAQLCPQEVGAGAGQLSQGPAISKHLMHGRVAALRLSVDWHVMFCVSPRCAGCCPCLWCSDDEEDPAAGHLDR